MRLTVFAPAIAVVAVLVAFASKYGYHRDELYFIAAGRHLDWAYVDQGPITPLIARAMTALAPDSLTMLRLPSALAAGLTVALTALLARDLGGSRRAQLIAASTAGAAVIVLFTGHLLNTSTFDLLVWTAVTWLVVKAIRDHSEWWLAAGVVLGIGLLNKPLPAFLAVAIFAGLLIAGPRRALRSPAPWAAAAIAFGLFAPFLLWQAAHDWPQLAVSASIAGGGSTSSEPWWAVVPFQVLLVSPPLAVIWILGLVRLFRDDGVRDLRFLGWTWVLLAVAFMALGGKPYYLAGLLPLLIAAGSSSVDRWIGEDRGRQQTVLTTIAVCAIIDSVIALPVLPARWVTPVVAVNEDVGETIGWYELVTDVAAVYHAQRADAVIVTSNYGEAGAIDHFGPGLGLPPAYSGHNAYADFRIPPDSAAPVVLIGYEPQPAAEWFENCSVAARITNAEGIDNDEASQPITVCARTRQPWSEIWPRLRHLG